ncbi:MAG TPA: RsmB/NOP family class I SAM-dependent RNA methyltransferase [Polyangiaceae bacterium]|nr:RsmB/NOP family class I SAM-dependent RNA methyltransferase [Polyangiaceae bacterium]
MGRELAGRKGLARLTDGEARETSAPVVATARSVAAQAVLRVLRDGAFAAAALSAELDRATVLEERDRALATELLYGTLRVRVALEARLVPLAPRGLKDLPVLAELLVAAYQLLSLDRVPAFAAVNAAVSAVRAKRGPRVAGFANAVLRKLAAGEKLVPAEAARQGIAPWLLEALERSVGAEEAAALILPQPDKVVGLRLIAGRPVPAWLADSAPGRLSPRARLVQGEGDPRKREGYAEGAFTVQEEGAQAIALALGARAGERVLDACAGRGQKTSLLAEQVGASGQVWAADVYPKKLEALAAEFERLQLRPPELRAVDWAVGVGDVPGDFDRVLVDAPCTGTGTLRRRPEIAARLEPSDPARLSALAETILRAAATRVKSSGRVLFAVCSVLEAECESLVSRVSDVLEPAPFDCPELSLALPESATSLRIGPTRFETDGYFAASFVRR